MRILIYVVTLVFAATLLPVLGSATSSAMPAERGNRTVFRGYGAGPVRLGSATTLRIRFDGRRGDRVRLDGVFGCPVTLRGPDKEKLSRAPDGFWRLRDPGRHAFTLRRCSPLTGTSKVQLQKLRFGRMTVDGPGVRLEAARGYVDAVRVTVPETGRLQVTGRDLKERVNFPFESIVLPDGTRHPEYGQAMWDTLFFEAGQPISGSTMQGLGRGHLIPEADDRITLIAAETVTVWQSLALTVPVTVDAPATTLPPNDVPYREYQVDFDAIAGTWLHAEVQGPSGPYPGHGAYWHIQTTGRYRLMVPTAEAPVSIQVRIRTIRVLRTPMPVDGTPLVLTTTEPGEWVLAPMTLPDNKLYQLHAGTTSTTGPWYAKAVSQAGSPSCGRGSGQDCGSWAYGSVGPDRPASELFGLQSGMGNPWMVLLCPYPDVTVSVQLSVTAATAGPGRAD